MTAKTRFLKILKPVVLIASITASLFWLTTIPAGSLGWLNAIGYSVCHQIPSHSYQIGSMQFPLCSRCMGMYLGTLIGFSFLLSQKKKAAIPSKGHLVIFSLFIIAWLIDGSNSFLGGLLSESPLYSPNNQLRLITGFGMGLTIALVVYLLFNQTVWTNIDHRSPLENKLLLPGMISATGVIYCLIVRSNEIFLTIFAYLSVTMVVVLLSLLYTIVWVIILHRENRFTRIRDMSLIINIGFLCAILQITLLDYARYSLTGTWASLGI